MKTRHRQTFYATPEVDSFLKQIPSQLRSNRINKIITEAIQEQSEQSELVRFRDWLKQHAELARPYAVIGEALDDYLNNRPTEQQSDPK